MNILIKHDGVLPVLKYGGTERIIGWLAKELVKKGHKVYLLSHPKSKIDGSILIPNYHDKDWRFLIPKDVDVISLFEVIKEKLDHPFLLQIGGNGKSGEIFPKNTVFVSKKHATNHGVNSYIYNGIDLEEYSFVKNKDLSWNNFMFLAKAKWKVKNLKDCIKACKETNKHLHVAGGRVFSLSKYIHSYGMVDINKKLEIFNKVDALLFPVRWHEPFGIAIIEAMAMGLPVIGSSYGSLPELIKENVGCICSNFYDFLNVLKNNVGNFNREEIRTYVEENFSSSKMADDYLSYYSKVISGEILNKNHPTWQSSFRADDLLDF